jgi:hypothetical protein
VLPLLLDTKTTNDADSIGHEEISGEGRNEDNLDLNLNLDLNHNHRALKSSKGGGNISFTGFKSQKSASTFTGLKSDKSMKSASKSDKSMSKLDKSSKSKGSKSRFTTTPTISLAPSVSDAPSTAPIAAPVAGAAGVTITSATFATFSETITTPPTFFRK